MILGVPLKTRGNISMGKTFRHEKEWGPRPPRNKKKNSPKKKKSSYKTALDEKRTFDEELKDILRNKRR